MKLYQAKKPIYFLKKKWIVIFSAGQKPVKDDCTRLSPTNMVIKNHLGEIK